MVVVAAHGGRALIPALSPGFSCCPRVGLAQRDAGRAQQKRSRRCVLSVDSPAHCIYHSPSPLRAAPDDVVAVSSVVGDLAQHHGLAQDLLKGALSSAAAPDAPPPPPPPPVQHTECVASGLDSVSCFIMEDDGGAVSSTQSLGQEPLAKQTGASTSGLDGTSMDGFWDDVAAKLGSGPTAQLMLKALQVAFLVSPFFFWGTSMPAMKVGA